MNDINDETIRFWEFHLKILLERERDLKKVLKRNLEREDEFERKNVWFNIESLCKTLIEIKFYNILLQTKNRKEAFDYKRDISNSKNIKQEIRKKFNIPDSIQEPIFIKDGLKEKREKIEYRFKEPVSESFTDQEWKEYVDKIRNLKPLNDKEWNEYLNQINLGQKNPNYKRYPWDIVYPPYNDSL